MRDVFHRNIKEMTTSSGKPIVGTEKKAYVDEDEKKVILKRNEQSKRDSKLENEMTLKAAFYLTKIARILFPKSIPDIHQVYYDDPGNKKSWTLVRKKVDPGKEHDQLQDVYQEHMNASSAVDTQKVEEIEEQEKDVIDDLSKRGWELIQQLEECGINHTDGAQAQNFGIDSEGNTIFVEEFRPFEIPKDGGIVYNLFKPKKLEEAISKIPDEKQRKRAEKYFERIIELREEAERQIEKK